jgi:hypothetical protein
MGTIVRGAKSTGGTDLATAGTVLAAELNTDFNTIVTEINGNLTAANISSSAAIPSSSLAEIDSANVSDHADTDGNYLLTTATGDSGSLSKPTSLEGEIERLRFQLASGKLTSTNLKYRDSAGTMQNASSWIEPPITGRNLLPNAGFEVHSAATPNAPDGWTLTGTPSTVAIENPAHTAIGLEKRSLNIVADAATEGIHVVLKGLKSSTKYLVGMVYVLANGKVSMTTTNGLGSGDYQNLNFIDTTASNLEVFQGIVKTTSAPADLTVSILSIDASDDFNIYYVWLYEMHAGYPDEHVHIPMQSATDSTELIYPTSPTAAGAIIWGAIAPLSLSQYVPSEGYRFIYEVELCWIIEQVAGAPDTAFNFYQHGVRIQVGGTTSGGERIIYRSSPLLHAESHFMTMKAIVENPEPGTTIAFTVDMGVYIHGSGDDYGYAILNSLRNSEQGESHARLYTERI